MIRQYRFMLESSMPFQAAYPMYAALLERAPKSFAEQVHSGNVTPISQYVWQNTWNVSLIGAPAIAALFPVLDDLESLFLRKLGREVSFTGKKVFVVNNVEELLLSEVRGTMRLYLRTPTAFKSSGTYQLLPTQRLILQSLILKWNGCFANVCPIEDEGEGLEAMAAGLVYHNVRLETQTYPMKHTTIPGVTGTLELENRLSGFHRQLAAALLKFGAYAGIGIKTTLGMGGLMVE